MINDISTCSIYNSPIVSWRLLCIIRQPPILLIMQETTINSESLYEGRIVSLRQDTVTLSDGTITQREVVDHKAAVVILPFERPHTLHLIKQYRYPIQQTLIECPAGLIEDHENPLDAAKRELLEETGFRANTWTPLGGGYPSPGFCNEKFYFFVAEDLTRGETAFDSDERIQQYPLSCQAVESLLEQGELLDIKTQLLYLRFKARYNPRP